MFKNKLTSALVLQSKYITNSRMSKKSPFVMLNKRFSDKYKSGDFNSKFKRNMTRPEDYKYKIEDYNPKTSKYNLTKENDIPPVVDMDPNTSVPKYLENEQYNPIKSVENEDNEAETKRPGISLKALKPGKRLNLPIKTTQYKMTKEARMENRQQLRLEEAEKFKKMTQEERKLIDNNDSALERTDKIYLAVQKEKYKEELTRMKQVKREERKLFNPEDLNSFKTAERLSKRLSRLGVTSRRQAEKMIETGMIKVDGKTVKENVAVTDESNIQVYSSNGYRTPIAESSRVWLFYKPVGVVCFPNDEKGRMSVFKFLEGKLDAGSEGLIVLTNNNDIAAALECNDTIERGYKVRVFGRMFSEEKLNQIRTGVKINMKPVKLWAEVISKQNSNTWLHIKSYNNSIIDIRNVFRRLSLRINQIIRTNYGPFSLGVLRHAGEITETNIPKAVNNYMYYRMREKTQSMVKKLDDTKIEKVKQDMLREQKAKRIAESFSKIPKINTAQISQNREREDTKRLSNRDKSIIKNK